MKWWYWSVFINYQMWTSTYWSHFILDQGRLLFGAFLITLKFASHYFLTIWKDQPKMICQNKLIISIINKFGNLWTARTLSSKHADRCLFRASQIWRFYFVSSQSKLIIFAFWKQVIWIHYPGLWGSLFKNYLLINIIHTLMLHPNCDR